MSSHFIQTLFSYNGNFMLAAIISLLLVILFVLLLHVYAKWFLAQARHRRSRSSMSVSHVLGPSRFHQFPSFTFENSLSTSPTKGLEASIISSIPLFVYKAEEFKQHGLECVICLSAFEESDVGRNLPKCHHPFHVECIDMWLHSHSSCPICRAPIVCESKGDQVGDSIEDRDGNSMEGGGESLEGELGLVGGESRVEIVIDVSDSGNENATMNKSLSADEEASSLGCSLKRMLSRNISECKVHPSSCATGLEA